MLALLALPAQGAGRGNGTPEPAHGSSKSTTAKHRSTGSAQPPKVPTVGAAAPAPVPVHKTAGARAATAEPAAESAVTDDDPVQDLVPVTDSPIGYVSPPTTIQPAIPSFNEVENRSRQIGSSGAVRAGTDASATTVAPRTSNAMWAQIDAASSQMQAELSSQPEYRAAVARLASAEQKVAALRSGGQKDSDQIRLAARQALEARQQIVQMQMSTLETDPNFQAALTRDEPAAVVRGQPQ